MSDLIRRSDAIDALKNALCELGGDEWGDGELGVHADDIDAIINDIPTIEPKRGKREEKETFHNEDDNPIIEEWQSARCSVCNKYHTTPYMYYFNDYNFCPNCGAEMRGEDDE